MIRGYDIGIMNTPEMKNGILALIGGGEFRKDCSIADEKLLRNIRKDSPLIAIIPTAAYDEDPELALYNGINHFNDMGAAPFGVMALTRSDTSNQTNLEKIQTADLIYFTGGNPTYLLDTLQGSPLLQTIITSYERGISIAGSSAGAMIFGQQFKYRNMWHKSLNWVTNSIVMPHHEEAPPTKIIQDTNMDLKSKTKLIGIDSSTALFIHSASCSVAGNGRVSFYQNGTHRTFMQKDPVSFTVNVNPNAYLTDH